LRYRAPVPGPRFTLLACFAALALAAPAHAVPIYKCRAPDGALTYQDTPCPADTEEEPAPLIAPPPPYVPPPPEVASSKPKRREAVEPPPEPLPPVPVMYRCYDGETGKPYVSATPQQNLRYVPLWTVLPSDSFANVGRSPPTPSPRSATQGTALGWNGAYGQYTAVEDRCREMPLGELCVYWDQHLDEVYKERRLAFKDRRGALEQEEAGLRENLRTFCGQ
jgi:hypothetical protein